MKISCFTENTIIERGHLPIYSEVPYESGKQLQTNNNFQKVWVLLLMQQQMGTAAFVEVDSVTTYHF